MSSFLTSSNQLASLHELWVSRTEMVFILPTYKCTHRPGCSMLKRFVTYATSWGSMIMNWSKKERRPNAQAELKHSRFSNFVFAPGSLLRWRADRDGSSGVSQEEDSVVAPSQSCVGTDVQWALFHFSTTNGVWALANLRTDCQAWSLICPQVAFLSPTHPPHQPWHAARVNRNTTQEITANLFPAANSVAEQKWNAVKGGSVAGWTLMTAAVDVSCWLDELGVTSLQPIGSVLRPVRQKNDVSSESSLVGFGFGRPSCIECIERTNQLSSLRSPFFGGTRYGKASGVLLCLEAHGVVGNQSRVNPHFHQFV
ncbi:hypothetical protein EDB84DRAFT_1441053 [Lactarius hengduanensis]|nr:hypothetical protein EDB84DRAFT_1441053 [Lactarius hengduanensis]